MKRAVLLAATLGLAGCGQDAAFGGGGKPDDSAEPPAAPVGEWLAGDMHVHDDHSSDGSFTRQGLEQRGPGNVSVADQIGQGVLNGLDWMPLTDHRTFDQHYDPLWESAELLLIPGEEANGSPHANVLGAVDTIVQGDSGESRPGWSRVQTSIWDAHSQGAAWSHNHPDDGHMNDDDSPNENASAIGADLMEVWNKGGPIERMLAHAERRWEAGFRFGMAGASDNHFRELWLVAGPGLPATSLFAAARSERAVLEAMLAGRSAIQNRELATPFLTLEADFQNDGVFEALGGDEIVALPGTAGTLRVSITGGIGTTVSVYKSPGKSAGAFASFQPTADAEAFAVEVQAEAGHTWYYAEARGPGELDSVNTGAVDNPLLLVEPGFGIDERRAITSPVFVGPALAEAVGELPLPADIGAGDGALEVLGEAGRFSGFPDVAVADGVTHIVAESHRDGRTAVVYRRIDAGGASGALSAPVDLAPDSASARFPKIAARGAQVWVAWQDERVDQQPHRPAIYLRQSTDGGQSFQAETVVRALDGRAERPDVALLPDDRPVVVWQEISAGNPFDVMAQVLGEAQPANLSRAGKTVQPANPVDTRSARYPASVWPTLAVREDGLVAVAFHDNRTDPDPLWSGRVLTGEEGATEVDDYQVLVVTRAGEGQWGSPVALGDPLRADRHAALGFTPDGALVAAWDSKEQRAAGANLSIRYAVSTDGGASFADAAASPALAEAPAAMSQYPRLGNDPDGTLRAVWYDNRAADWRWRVMTARFDGAWSDATIIQSRGVNTWPATGGGKIVFASTRNAQRLQRDRTQQVFLLDGG